MSVSISYAKALYEAAKDSKLSGEMIDQLEAQMDQLSDILAKSKDVKIALFSPLTSVKEKVALLEELSKQLKLSPLATQFFNLLARKGRLSLLQEVRDAFSSVRLASEGGVSGQVVAAESMSDSDLNILVKAFSQKLGKKVAFRVSTDPSLLAGMKVTVNGVTYDGSLRSQIQKLRDHFAAGLSRSHL